jgi:hypothetical protein
LAKIAVVARRKGLSTNLVETIMDYLERVYNSLLHNLLWRQKSALAGSFILPEALSKSYIECLFCGENRGSTR